MRKNVTKKLMSMLLSIVLVIGLLSGITMVSEPITADAAPALLGASEPVTYIYRDENNLGGEARTCSDYTLVTSANPVTSYTTGWYVFQGNAEFDARIIEKDGESSIQYPERLEVEGDVNIILMDDCRFYVPLGIHIKQGAHLNIYGQQNDSGQLRVGPHLNDYTSKDFTEMLLIGGNLNCPLGGNYKEDAYGASLTINGGYISAQGSKGSAGIGAGPKGIFGCITINGGTVFAKGGEDAAGIGGGDEGGVISTITINGGNVEARGGDKRGAGIGGGDKSDDGGKIIINGGDVYAVGGGENKWHGWSEAGRGAGIGGGQERSGPDEILITGGKVKAEGSYYGAGIGGGYEAASGNITISGGEVNVLCGNTSAGIGGGKTKGIGDGKRVLITDGRVKITVGTEKDDSKTYSGAGIGGGQGCTQGGDIIIRGGEVSSESWCGAGIGGGGAYGHAGGNVIISGGVVATTSMTGAGIGGGGHTVDRSYDRYKETGDGGNVTISGGDVYASSTKGGAAIGGGAGRNGGSLTITGGYVVATTSSLKYDWVNEMQPKHSVKNYGEDMAAVISNLIFKKVFSHPVDKSPAAIGGGYAPVVGGGGKAGSFKMTGGTLLARSGLNKVGAIGGGSDNDAEGSYNISDNMSVLTTYSMQMSPNDFTPTMSFNRISNIKNAPYIVIEECPHYYFDYSSTQHGHTCNCPYCYEGKLGEQPHHWDASGMTCEDCGYKRTDGLSATFVNQDESYLYTGEEIRPEVKVSLSGKSLTAGTDYDVTYSNNTTVGMAKITVTMKGENSGLEPFVLSFEIKKAALEQVELSPYTYPYDGSSHPRPGVSAKSGGRTVDPSEYVVNPTVGNQTDAGSYLITLEAKDEGNYEGNFTAMWSIAPREIKQDEITCNIESSSYTYDGTAKTPSVTVTDSGLVSGSPKVLEQGKDYTVTYKNNINAGKGTVIITGEGNYTGTVEKTFTIEKATITRIDLIKKFIEYTGSLHKVSVLRAVAYGVNGEEMEVPLNECIISGDTGINAGTYSLKIDTLDSSNFKYDDDAPFNWYIRQKVLTDYATLYSDEYIYTGREIKPDVCVTDGNVMLKEGQDYELAYEDNISEGTGKVKVTLKGNYYDYSGPKILPFTITEAGTLQDISNCTVQLSPTGYTYDGSSKTPDVTVKKGDTTLTEGTDYTVKCWNNTDAGTAVAVVEGKGAYRGAAKATYTINPAQIDADDIEATLSDTAFVYDGNEKTPIVTVKQNGVTLIGANEADITTGVDSVDAYDYTYKYEDNQNAGTAKVVITGKGNYTGTGELTFSIAKAKIDMAELSESYFFSSHGVHNMRLFASADGMMLPKDSYEVSGDVVTVPDEEEQPDDYSVSLLAKNGGIGDYSVTVTAKSNSNYQGSVTIPFYIVEDGTSLFDAQLLETRYIYDGNAKKPDVVVTGEKGILTEGKDYTLEYRDNVNAGTAAVVVSGMGNYHGSRTLFYTIEKAQLDVVNISDPVLTYTREEQTVDVLSVFADKTETYDNYVPEENYIVSGNKAKDVGTYQLTVTAKDNSNYTGSVSVPYTIVSESDKVFTAQLESYETTYDGTAKEPEVIVKYGDTKLTKDTDYTVTYQDNVDAGVARIFITGKDKNDGTREYEGTRVLLFRINKAPLQSVQLEGDSALTYNGDYQTVTVKEVKAGDDSVQTPITVPSEAYSITGDTVRSPGEYTLKATAKTHSNFTGEATTSFEIKPNNSALWMDIQDTEFIYNGKEQKPIVYIYDGDERLTQGEDYNIEYSDNVNAGAGMIKVTYLGKYAGGDVDVYSCSFAIDKATPVISTLPTASKVTSGQTLADSTLRGGKATVDGKTIQGQFEWEDSTIAPDVSDSDAEYTVKFIPTDNANYSVVTCEVKLGAKSVTPTPTPTPVPDEDYQVPIENKSAIDINAHISGGIATISDISSEAIESVIQGDGREPSGDSTGKITIDISCAAQTVTGIEIGKQTLDNLSNAVNNNAEIDAVEIKLTDTYVMLDGTAAEAIASQAQGDTIRLKINTKTESSLNNAQRTALSAFSYRSLFEAYFESGGEKIGDFGGGQATVSVKQGIPEGMDARYFHIYYVPEDGNLTVHKTWYENGMLSFKTGHFSDYSIVYDDTMRNDTLPEGFTRNTDGTLTFTDPELGTAIIADEVVREGKTYRMYNPNTGEHTFTKNAVEVIGNESLGWNHEEDADFMTFGYDTKDSLIVYRLYSKYTGLHHYTMDRDEAIWNVQALGYNFEGIVFYALPSDSTRGTELYRLYNPYDYQHLWTTNKDEYDYLGSVGWNKEGVAFKVQ